MTDLVFQPRPSNDSVEVATQTTPFGQLKFYLSRSQRPGRVITVATCEVCLHDWPGSVFSWYRECESREEALAWCESTKGVAEQTCNELFEVSAKFKPGLYLMPARDDGDGSDTWTIVKVTLQCGVAQVWYLAWDIPDLILHTRWEKLRPLPPIQLDNQIISLGPARDA